LLGKGVTLLGGIDDSMLRRHIEENEHQIAQLQSEMSEEAQLRQMIEMTANMLADMGRFKSLWPTFFHQASNI
jgi:hypothetical protein